VRDAGVPGARGALASLGCCEMAHARPPERCCHRSGAVIAAPLMQNVFASNQLASTVQERNAREWCAPGGSSEGNLQQAPWQRGLNALYVSRHPFVTITV
jgi:hypothetical protein